MQDLLSNDCGDANAAKLLDELESVDSFAGDLEHRLDAMLMRLDGVIDNMDVGHHSHMTEIDLAAEQDNKPPFAQQSS